MKWSHKREVRELMPDLVWLHHSPNGGKRDAFVGAQMTALGVKPGFPDLILPAPRGSHPGLIIEMKSMAGRITPKQGTWLAHFEDSGWACFLCRSAEEAREELCNYFGLDPASVPQL